MVVWFNESKKKTQIRYAVMVLALVVVGQMSLQQVSISSLAISAYQNLATIASMSASIAPNPANLLAVEFDQKAKELSAREQELEVRERALDAKVAEAVATNKRLTLMVLGGITLLLLVLILLNFYFDIKREEARTKDTEENHQPEFSTKL